MTYNINGIQVAHPYEGKLVKGTLMSAGYDIETPYLIRLEPGMNRINLGIRFQNGLPNTALLILRSSFQNKGLIQASIGIIDRDYNDWIFINIYNMKKRIDFNSNTRLAQLIFFDHKLPYDVEYLKVTREV